MPSTVNPALPHTSLLLEQAATAETNPPTVAAVPPQSLPEARLPTSVLSPPAAAAGSGRLDSHEINVAPPHADTPSQRMRFATCLEERDRWLALIDQAEPSFAARARFRNCGSHASLSYSPSEQRYFVQASSCKNRFCPACRVRRQLAIRDSLARYFVNHPAREWQFITLTVKHSNAPLALQLDWLQRSFKTLRSNPVWTKNVTHGFAVLEITRNAKAQQWHPHLHVLAHVRFLDWSKLRSAWSRITHGSNVIDCQRVNREADAIRYVLAYLGKPPSDTVLHDDAAMLELYLALHSQHLLIRFGKPPTKPPPATRVLLPTDLVYLGSIETMIDDALNGDERMRLHLERWLLQRRVDAESLRPSTLLDAIARPPPKRRTVEEVVAFETAMQDFRNDLLPQTPF